MAAISHMTISNVFSNIWISINISLKFVPEGRINNIPALVQIMAWRQWGNKPLSEPIMVSLLMHICITRPQWLKDVHVPTFYIISWILFNRRTLKKSKFTMEQPYMLPILYTKDMHMKFETEIPKQTWVTLPKPSHPETEKSNLATRQPFRKWGHWKSIGSYPYT